MDDIEFSELKHSIYFLGDILKKRRLHLNLTQDVLAFEAGISRSTLSLIENNKPCNTKDVKKVILALTGIGILRSTT